MAPVNHACSWAVAEVFLILGMEQVGTALLYKAPASSPLKRQPRALQPSSRHRGQAGSLFLCSARLHEGWPLKAASAETQLDGAQQPLNNLISGKPVRPDLCRWDAVQSACRSPATSLLPAPSEQKGKENRGCLGRPRDRGRGHVLAEEQGRDSPHEQPPSSAPLSACSRH